MSGQTSSELREQAYQKKVEARQYWNPDTLEGSNKNKYDALIEEADRLNEEADRLDGLAEECEQRKQEHEDNKQDFELPHDYNAKFGDHRANDEITQLLLQVQDQCFEWAEAKIAEQQEKHREELASVKSGYEEQIAQLKRQNDHLQEELAGIQSDLEHKNETISEIKGKLNDAELRADDAEAKRDAAVRELEQAKDRIRELEEGKPVVKVSDKRAFQIELKSDLKDAPIRSSRDIALERAGVMAPSLPNVEVQPEGNLFRDETDTQDSGVLDQSADASNQEVQQEVTFPVPDVQAADGRDTLHETMERTENFDMEAEVKRLKAIIDYNLAVGKLKEYKETAA